VRQITSFLLAIAAVLAVQTAARAQIERPQGGKTHFTDGIIGQFDETADFALEPATLTARIAAPTADRPAVLLITAKIAPGRHTYSLTQPKGGPRPTRIDLDPSSNYRLLGTFRAHPEPNTRIEKGPVWTGLQIEEHEGEVTWYAPIEMKAGVDPKTFAIHGAAHLEVCQTDGYCEPVEKQFAAKVEQIADLGFPLDEAEAAAVPTAQPSPAADNSATKPGVGSYQPANSAVKFRGELLPGTARAGDSADVVITATLPAGGRIYALADRDPARGTKPTLIALQTASGLVPHRPTTDAPIHVDDSVEQFGVMKYHQGTVTWKLRLDVPKTATAGSYPIRGLLGYQMCEYGGEGNNVCELPQALVFQGTVQVGETANAAPSPLKFSQAPNYSQVAQAAAVFADNFDRQAPGKETETATAPRPEDSDVPTIRSADTYDLSRVMLANTNGSLGYYIALAFVGGLILNLMPCVLPVIGLKVMSFVEQAGRSRHHALMLNLWYAAGIIAVFLLLGALSITINLGWGGQFGSTTFNVTMAAVVFAMALSLLGIWEVPIPGFFGSGSVQSAAAQEGPLGALLKGIVTTVLATPCLAPFMAPAIAWAAGQSPATTLIIFAAVGIGMASPYVLIGYYPELLRFLPKPGAWMETFKQAMGFVLLATVVFILSFIEPAAVVPTIALLLGIGLACWLAGRTPLTAELNDRVQSFGVAAAVTVLFALGAFGWLYPKVMAPRFAGQVIAKSAGNSPWQPFSLERLKQLAVDEGKTVLVDFSADWCFNCKALELAVLHTDAVEKAISESGAVTMYADYTDYPAEITDTIKALGANGVPVIAVFPGDTPFEPIVFNGSYTAGGLIGALEKATGRRLQENGAAIAEVTPATPPRN
jgi:thiol:disulfide interchange protein